MLISELREQSRAGSSYRLRLPCGKDHTRVRASLAEKVPLICDKDAKIGFRAEGLAPEPAMQAAQEKVLGLIMTVDAAAATATIDIVRRKAIFGRAFTNEAKPIGNTGNLHFGSLI